MADKYDVASDVCAERANERIRTSASTALRDSVQGYDAVTPEHVGVQISDGKVRYALYPVWLLTTTYKGERYQFAMNGQSGKFIGNMPMDKGAYWKWRLIYSGVIGAVIWGALYLLSNIL